MTYLKSLALLLAVVSLWTTGCDRSSVRADWLLQRYLTQKRGTGWPDDTGILLFLRARYGRWTAGELASTVLKSEAALARSRYERQLSQLYRIEPVPFLPSVQDSPERFSLGDSADVFVVVDSVLTIYLDQNGKTRIYARIRPGPANPRAAAVSPDGRLLAWRAEGRNIAVFNIWTGRRYRGLISPLTGNTRLAFTYGSILLEMNEKGAVGYDAEYAEKILQIDIPPQFRPESFGVSEDGNTLLFRQGRMALSYPLGEILRNYMIYRTFAELPDTFPDFPEQIESIGLSVDSALIPARLGMVRIEAESGDSVPGDFLVDRRVVGQGELSRFRMAGGYTVPGWWSGQGLAYTLAQGGLSRMIPESVSMQSPADSDQPAPVSWFEAEALAGYLGKKIPDDDRWEAALETGKLSLVPGEAAEWCAPREKPLETGYETSDELLRYPVKFVRPDRESTLSSRQVSTWLLPGHYRGNTFVRFMCR